MSLQSIRKIPTFIEGVGNVYPIEIKDYDEFQKYSEVLYISKGHFENGDNYKLLDLLIHGFRDEALEKNITNLLNIFKLTLRKEVFFHRNDNDILYGFLIDEEKQLFVVPENYEELRKVIMEQNILHEPKIFKNKIVQEWAEKVIESKSKKSLNISLEDMITTVSVKKCKHYEELDNYSIYQIYSDFYRIRKDKEYDTSISFACVGGNSNIKDFAENLDLYHNPYDDLFVDSSKLDGLNKALK